MTEQKFNCEPCHPFTKEKCCMCIMQKLDDISFARTRARNEDQAHDLQERGDAFSILPETLLIESGLDTDEPW